MTAATARQEPRRALPVPGDGLLHPIPILAILLMVANDHALKQLWPGLITGKLSDFAGLVFFPLFLQAAWETISNAFGRGAVGDRRVLLVSIIATGVVFASIKLLPVAGNVYRTGLGTLQWLSGVAFSALPGHVYDSPQSVALSADPTDLVALPALAVAWLVSVARTRRVLHATL
jgi:hypothetical protein